MIDPDALRRRIAGKRDDVVELTRSLIRFPTVNPPGSSLAAAAALRAASTSDGVWKSDDSEDEPCDSAGGMSTAGARA